MLKNILKAEKVVSQVLAQHPVTRSDDKELILQVWEEQGFVLTPAQKDQFKACYSPETIRRTRQKLQESGKFPPLEVIKNYRFRNDVEMRNYFAGIKREVIYVDNVAQVTEKS